MYASVNTLAHKFNMYPLLQNTVYFFNRTFVKKTKYPIISICLFIITVVLNSIQYANNKKYLQDKIIVSNKDYSYGTSNISNILLFIYDFIGINGFIDNTPGYIFVFIVAYFALALIELNIGYLSLLFLLVIDLIFNSFWDAFHKNICENTKKDIDVTDLYMCCGSFLLFMSLGFVLVLIQKNIINIYYRIIVIFIILFVWSCGVLYDKYSRFNDMKNDASQQTCSIFNYHAASFLFGISCGFALGN
jgi:hypothetical protein